MELSVATCFADSTNPVDLHEIPVAITGSWVKDGHRFSITKEDLDDIVTNFAKRKNGEVVIDYEHASERPDVARGGPVPAAGWIHGLTVRAQDEGSGEVLWATVEWEKDAREMLESKKYKFFSPAIDWGAVDKKTGRSKGATITSGALTNHPFLEELPAIQLSENAKQIVVPVVDGAKIKVKVDAKHDEAEKQKLAEISLDQKRMAVGDAVREKFGNKLSYPEMASGPWVKEVFDGHVIVECEGKLFKVDYTVDDKGDVKLGEPKQVNVEYVEASELSEATMERMTDKKFSEGVLKVIEQLTEKDKVGNSKKLCESVRAALTTREGALAMNDVQLGESVIRLLDDIDAYGVEGDRGDQDGLRSEAESRAKKIDSPSDDDETEELREKAKKEEDDALEATDSASGGKIARFSIRKMRAADGVGRLGHHAVIAADGKLAGFISHGDLMKHAARHGAGGGTMKASEKDVEEVIKEKTGRPLTLSETVKLVETGINAKELQEQAEGADARKASHKLMLSTAVDDKGQFSARAVRRLLGDERITQRDYADFVDAVEDADKVIAEGRFLPKQRKLLVQLCLTDRKMFEDLANSQSKHLHLFSQEGTSGTGEESGNPQAEIDGRINQMMRENDKLSYRDAYTKVLASDANLKKRYDEFTKNARTGQRLM